MIYIVRRFGIIFSHQRIYLVIGSIIFAGIGTIMNFCYLAKNRILHSIGGIFLWIFCILAVSTLILIVEQILHPNVKLP
ncbi:MAG: hypothetical protein LBG52_00185 [Candidatus Peribacteria bacterium]|nr:hypothetical protein [Candidatus Peribacteria bacterium]